MARESVSIELLKAFPFAGVCDPKGLITSLVDLAEVGVADLEVNRFDMTPYERKKRNGCVFYSSTLPRMEQLFLRSEEDITALARCSTLGEQSELGQEIKSTLLRIQSAIKVRPLLRRWCATLMQYP